MDPLLAERSRGMLVAVDRVYADPVRLREKLPEHEYVGHFFRWRNYMVRIKDS
jgi:hypothetical protein